MEIAANNILEEMKEQVAYFKSEDKLLEAQRIAERTNFDVEMMRETGFCSGIENYSRHLIGSKPGEPPCTLMDYFPDEFLVIVDESHHAAAGARYVRGRPVAQENAGGIWIPPAVGAG